MKEKMRNLAVAALLVFGVAGFSACGSTQSVEEIITQAVAEANKELPLMVDEHIRLDGLSALPGRVIQYNYTFISASNEEIDVEGFAASIGQMLSESVKNDANLESFRKREVTFKYRYQDKDGNETVVFEYTPEDYK